MRALISPFQGKGSIVAPSSKSELHRLLIASALSDRNTVIHCRAINNDVRATIDCLRQFGAVITETGSGLTVQPIWKGRRTASPVLDCSESGSTLRFMLPVAAALGGASFIGCGRLPERPLSDLIDEMKVHGAVFTGEKLPFSVSGKLSGGGEYYLPGNVSSQYVTGIMLAAPLMGKTIIRIEGNLQSVSYVQMTADVMARFGISVSMTENTIVINDHQQYKSCGIIEADGDWSGAAFPLSLGALGGPVVLQGLNKESIQGDRRVIDILKKAGAVVAFLDNSIIVKGKMISGVTLDVSDIPDLVPVLAAVFMHGKGHTVFTHAERLRLKESDRLVTTCAMVNALGGHAEIRGDSLHIDGRPDCPGGIVNGAGDHRIVMAAVIGASDCKGPSEIIGAEAVSKSWPSFYDDMRAIGGAPDVISVW